MSVRKFAADFESLTAASEVGPGNWADISDCKQIDYGIQQVTGPITGGGLVLESCSDLNQQPLLVATVDATLLGTLGTRGYQVSEPKPHGKYLRWNITDAIVGGTITATINGQHG